MKSCNTYVVVDRCELFPLLFSRESYICILIHIVNRNSSSGSPWSSREYMMNHIRNQLYNTFGNSSRHIRTMIEFLSYRDRFHRALSDPTIAKESVTIALILNMLNFARYYFLFCQSLLLKWERSSNIIFELKSNAPIVQ